MFSVATAHVGYEVFTVDNSAKRTVVVDSWPSRESIDIFGTWMCHALLVLKQN